MISKRKCATIFYFDLASGEIQIDLYNVDGKIYFGEMTFTNGSGLDPIVPEKYDKVLGDYWKLPIDQERKK